MDLSDVWFNIARDSPAFLNLFAFESPRNWRRLVLRLMRLSQGNWRHLVMDTVKHIGFPRIS